MDLESKTTETSLNNSNNKELQEMNNVKLELNVKPNRYEKDDYAKMSDGMVP